VSEGREPPPDEEGLSEEELAGEEATELPARQALSSIGDISIPFDPHLAADALLGQDPEDAEDGASD
jgi:hypothetical protein